MSGSLVETGVLLLNFLLCVVIIGFVKKQKLKRYVLLKKSFYGFYVVALLSFVSHFLRHAYTDDFGRLAWTLEATGWIIAAWIFGNVVVTLRYPRAMDSVHLIKEYFSNPPRLHFIYSIIMWGGVFIVWGANPFVGSTPISGYKLWFILYIFVMVISAALFPTYFMLKHISEQKEGGLQKAYSKKFKIMIFSYLFLVLLINTSYALTWRTGNHDIETLAYFLSAIPLALMAYALKEPRLLEGFTFRKPQREEKLSVSRFLKTIGNSALIEYVPTDSYEKTTISVVANYLSSGTNVLLVSQAPRSKIYQEKFEYFIAKDMAKIVEITSESPLNNPEMFSVRNGDTPTDTNGEAISIHVSINKLEYLSEMVGQLPEGSVLIFEALSGVILGLAEDTQSIYKFVSGLVEKMSSRKRFITAFLNRGAHEREVISAYEGLFNSILRIEDDTIITLKGERLEIPIEDF